MILLNPISTLNAIRTHAVAYAKLTQQAQEQLVYEPMRQCSAMMVNFAPTPQAKQAAMFINESTERTIALSKAFHKAL